MQRIHAGKITRAFRHWSTPTVRSGGTLGLEKEKPKVDIRKLKELGLTESLLPGYRISPRGKTFLENN